MGDTESDSFSRWPLLNYIVDTLLTPIRIALSPALLRTYLRTFLVLLASSILFGAAIIAYTTFYLSYIPVRGISVPVYLQFDHGRSLPISSTPASDPLSPKPTSNVTPVAKFPYGIANVGGLVSRQKYDVLVDVVLPRSEKNLDAGNWMVGLEMRGPVEAGGGVKQMFGFGEEWDVDDFSQGGVAGRERESVPGGTAAEGLAGTGTGSGAEMVKPVVLARSRRPAILTYRSWMTEFAYRALRLPLYVVGWGTESEKVEIRMMEGVEFEKGWKSVPTSVRLEVRSRAPMEVYSVGVRFVARLEGLRWIMFHYRITSLVIFTGLFWGVEMGILLFTWGVFSILFGGNEAGQEGRIVKKEKEIKREQGTETPRSEASSIPSTPLSETSRTFPTLPSQRPLQYTSPTESGIKDERATPRLEDIPARTEAEADDEEDEDEDADFILEEPIPPSAANVLTDSGIGTSMDSSKEGLGLSRRRSGKREW